MTAVLFGSIGSLADTSELQREAFNEAFSQHGLDWRWERPEYQRLLGDSGGQARIQAYAEARGEDVDAAAVHATKSEIFQRRLRDDAVPARPGVVETILAARAANAKIALVTTTSRANIDALAASLGSGVDLDSFDLILDTTDVPAAKPAPDVYTLALERLGESSAGVVAIEDNAGGVAAAVAAEVPVIAFPGENNAEHDFSDAERTVGMLNPEDLSPLSASR